jgi:hypothetical protein
MTVVNAVSKSQEPQQARQQAPQLEQPGPRREQTSLDHRYGKIGILAVAAAARYAGAGKKPAGAPRAAQIEQRFIELAS